MLGQTTDAPTSEVEQDEEEIQLWKKEVKKYETEANEQEAKLNQGLFWYNYTCAMNTIN